MRDFLHLWWSLVYWNARKTGFVVRGRRGHAPCQSPCDSGRAGVTHCEAAMTWDRPARFVRVCPHLRRVEGAWMCGVDAAAVRPFWGRALAWFAGAAVAAYLLGAVGVWGALVARGHRGISPLDTAWPARWDRLTTARRQLFLRQAQEALARRDVAGMWVSLASAAAAAPKDYESRLALAQIHAHLLMGSLAGEEFRDLFAQFPAERMRTAVVYHDVLISTGEFASLGAFALAELANAAPEQRGPWLQAVGLALRTSPEFRHAISRGAELGSKLPELEQQVIRAEAAVRGGELAALERWPAVPASRENAALMILTAETFIDFASTPAAMAAITRAGTVAGEFEHARLLHRFHARTNAARLALQSLEVMAALADTRSKRERLVAAAVEFPDPAGVGRLGARLDRESRLTQDELGSLWVAAVMAGHEPVRELAERRLQQEHGFRVPEGTPRAVSPANCALWIKVVPLSRSTAAALALKFSASGGEAISGGG